MSSSTCRLIRLRWLTACGSCLMFCCFSAGAVPDGPPEAPGGALVFAIAAEPISVRRVVVTNTVTHQRFGDLIGTLSHGSQFAVLNNHRDPMSPPPETFTYIYEDHEEGDPPNAQRTDGPGSLRNFVGEEGAGLWLMLMGKYHTLS